MIKELPYNVFNKVPLTCFRGIKGSRLHLVHTEEEFKDVYEILKTKKHLSTDVETDGFLWFGDNRICGISIGYELDHFYIPVRHKDSVSCGKQIDQLSMDFVRPYFKELFADPTRALILHNAKFDQHFFETDGIPVHCIIHDTRTLLHLYDENIPGELKVSSSGWRDMMHLWHEGLVHPESNSEKKAVSKWRSAEAKARKDRWKEMVKEEVARMASEMQYQKVKPKELAAIAKKDLWDHPYRDAKLGDISYDYIPIVDMVQYAALDTFLTWELYCKCFPYVVKSHPRIYKNEMKLHHALMDIERPGIHIDVEHFKETQKIVLGRCEQLENELKEVLGDINFNSTKQLQKALLAQGVVLTKLTKTGKKAVAEGGDPIYSLGNKVLVRLANKYPIINRMVTYRKLQKLNSGYIEPLIHKSINGIAFASFNSNVKTGRLSSGGKTAAINFQTLPSGDKTIKKGIICPPDYYFVCFDYSQIELRITADESEDPLLMEAFLNGEDLHLKTCCKMFDIPLEQALFIRSDDSHPKYHWLDQLRKAAKIINFSIVYGVTGAGLSEQIPRPDQYKDYSDESWAAVCEDFLDRYLDAHRGVTTFIYYAKMEVKMNKKVVTTDFGRVRKLPHVDAFKITKNSDVRWMEESALRQGPNFKIQGRAADIFKFALVRVHERLKGTKSYIVNLVHDDIQMYIHKDDIHIIKDIKAIMEDYKLKVPVIADCTISSTNLADKREVKNIEEFLDGLRAA
jgi:DNA polymerase I-like protein with 3'-5' exonuclease and polymerase domains